MACWASWLAAELRGDAILGPGWYLPLGRGHRDPFRRRWLRTALLRALTEQRLREVQVHAYSSVCDLCTLVIHPDHLAAARALLPDWWGITTLDDQLAFTEMRQARENPDPALGLRLSLLRKGELRDLLILFEHDAGVRSKAKMAMQRRALSRFTANEVLFATRHLLCERFASG